MARISKYQFDQNVTKEDFVIGSDGVTKKTRNFKLDDLTSFFGKQQAILGDKFAYVYQQGSEFANLQQGQISFNNKNVLQTPFLGVNTIYINRYNQEENDVLSYLDAIRSFDGVLTLHNSQNTTYFGAYKIQDVNILSGDVIEVLVDVRSHNGYVLAAQAVNVSAVFSNSDKEYVHDQISSSSTWNVQHDLNKYPSVTIVDTGNNVVYGNIEYVDKNKLTINFNVAFSGKAFIN